MQNFRSKILNFRLFSTFSISGTPYAYELIITYIHTYLLIPKQSLSIGRFGNCREVGLQHHPFVRRATKCFGWTQVRGGGFQMNTQLIQSKYFTFPKEKVFILLFRRKTRFYITARRDFDNLLDVLCGTLSLASHSLPAQPSSH